TISRRLGGHGLGAEDQAALKLIVRNVGDVFLAILRASRHTKRACRHLEQRTGHLRVVHREARQTAAYEICRDRFDHFGWVLHATERVVASRVDLRLQQVGANPTLSSVSRLLGFAARTLRRNFPAPTGYLASNTDDAAQIIRFD